MSQGGVFKVDERKKHWTFLPPANKKALEYCKLLVFKVDGRKKHAEVELYMVIWKLWKFTEYMEIIFFVLFE
jgi:hypothetical protein